MVWSMRRESWLSGACFDDLPVVSDLHPAGLDLESVGVVEVAEWKLSAPKVWRQAQWGTSLTNDFDERRAVWVSPRIARRSVSAMRW